MFLRASANAKTIMAVGTCAVFGGIPAATGNPTGAAPVEQFMRQHNLDVPWVALPGCPAHPDWIIGTLAHLLKFGMPTLDQKRRPVAFFSRSIHAQCPRSHDYDNERFAHKFGDPGCLHELGCMGIRTLGDCTLRLWNSGTNSCIRAGAPCIGCTCETFGRLRETPLFKKVDPATS